MIDVEEMELNSILNPARIRISPKIESIDPITKDLSFTKFGSNIRQ